MHILVPIKAVPDYKLRLQLNAEQTDIDTTGVKMILNPFDAIALQQAVNIKKLKPDTRITSLFITTENNQTLVRESLALGADQAIHITTEQQLSSLNIAKILKNIIEQQSNIDLVLMGKQAIDTDSNQTAQMLAALLNWPNVCFISDLDIDFKNKQFKAMCEWDQGLVKAESSLPAVISCDLRLNTPAPANMMAIMKAKQKPVETISLESMALPLKLQQKLVKLEKPSKRSDAKKLDTIETLIETIETIRGDL